jgi:hypothetical protein
MSPTFKESGATTTHVDDVQPIIIVLSRHNTSSPQEVHVCHITCYSLQAHLLACPSAVRPPIVAITVPYCKKVRFMYLQ